MHAVLEEQGLGGSDVAITGSDERDYMLIRTEALALEGPTVVEGSAAAAVASAVARGRRVCRRRRRPRSRRRRRAAAASAAATAACRGRVRIRPRVCRARLVPGA